ncbi:hypothetical protein [Mucilaginibacter sp. KACC 22063]|uniref:hypothetical protein n=1 Tax=Mucilaginibacter sp. KACC 22063 TaxID=3025666 RepID=UPI002365902A|nr:hypothetical protein [Mucilaginibacter sp. KACC 22063]WDF53336.1 hypothetical protein PQ461_10285 [Mucilaginibacter sp. KACC 22063]
MKLWQRILVVWGGFSLIAIMVFTGYMIYSMTVGDTVEIDQATVSDVRFVLNWCGLGEQRIERVMHSYSTPTSLTGDHLTEYSIKINHVTKEELENANVIRGKWYRGDKLPQVLDEAVSFIARSQGETTWFPKEKNIKTQDYYIYSCIIGYVGLNPNSAQLIFINLKDKMVYYADEKI